jgi:hypothetical protein
MIVQLALMAISWPFGNFPTNDDWAYVHSAQWLLTEHRIRLSDWIGMNLLPQTLLGGGTIYLLGFSFSVLRVLTEVISLLAGLSAFGLFRVSGMAPRAAFSAALCLVTLPWWQVLANSYMSDMYGMALAIPAAYFFVKQIQTPRLTWLLAGTALAAFGILQRQVVAVIPLAFMFGWLAAVRPMSARSWLVAIFPFLVASASELFYQHYLAHGPGIPVAQLGLNERLVQMGLGVIKFEPARVSWMFHNLLQMGGLLGMSLAVWALLGLNWSADRRHAVGFILLAMLLLAGIFATGWLPPYRQNNVLDAAGIGPFTIGQGMTPGELAIGRDKGLFWDGAGLLAGTGMAFLLVLVSATLWRGWHLPQAQRGLLVFMASCVIGYLIPFAVTDYFDRYLLFVMPFLLGWAGLIFSPAPGHQRWTVLALLMIGVLSAAALHDYFSWNRARWQAIAYAESRFGAGPSNIDGGFEFNGFYNYESRKIAGSAPGKQWWWVVDDQFLVSLSPKISYEQISRFPVKRWFTTTPPDIYLLRRNNSKTEATP